MKTLYLIFFLSCFGGKICSSGTIFNKISQQIVKCHGREDEGFEIDNTFHKTRLILYDRDDIHFTNEIDTLFILEGWEPQTGVCFSKIWNIDGKVTSYRYRPFIDSLETGINVFDPYISSLVEKWDIDKIKENEESLPPKFDGLLIYANRITKQEYNSYKVECVCFQEFSIPKEYRR